MFSVIFTTRGKDGEPQLPYSHTHRQTGVECYLLLILLLLLNKTNALICDLFLFNFPFTNTCENRFYYQRCLGTKKSIHVNNKSAG